MKYKRLYTFGCSFTRWYWPTWADIIAYDTKLPYENWAESGSGNVGIANRMLECDLTNKFTKRDMVLVCWSTFCREDRYIRPDGWIFGGNIFNSRMYDDAFREKYHNSANDIIKNMHSIITSRRSFPIAYEAQITESLGSDIIESGDDIWQGKLEHIIDFYKPYQVKNIFPWDHNHQAPFENYAPNWDGHPDIQAHLKFVTEYIYPSLGLAIKQSTVDHFMELQDHITKKAKTQTFKKFKDIKAWFDKTIDHPDRKIGMI